MAFRPILRRRTIPATASILLASNILFPKATLHAEAPSGEPLTRKPIYDDLTPLPKPPKYKPSNPDSPSSSSPSSSPTPTDRLASQVRHARLFLNTHAATAETRLNTLMSSILHLESSFTSTIASLAPPPESNERLLPGSIYVLVAAMAGSIVSRNRNILLRASVPVAVGVGAGWVVLPLTMRNVGDLLWRYEEKVPVVSMNHMRIRGAAEESWRQIKIHGELMRGWSEERVKDGREAVEGWVRKGR